MPRTETGEAVQLLDVMLRFFAEDSHWMRGRYHDGHGRRCLVGAVFYFSSKHQLPRQPVIALLEAALPQRQLGLVHFNDYRCRSIAELRSVIVKARALALENAENERTAAALERRLLAEVKCERAARAASSDTRETYILSLSALGETAMAPVRLAA
jgi:hypothetical protein